MDTKGSKRKERSELEVSGQPLTKKPKKSKEKTRESRKELPAIGTSEGGKREEFTSVDAQMTITIPPPYSGPGRPRQAAQEMLDSMIMRYIPALGGVILAHSNLRFLSTTATFLIDSPFAKADISFTALVWGPSTGSKLRGSISICSPDHIGLLIHKTFNASIPRHHIPIDEWEFEYGTPENDPEYGAAALGEEQVEEENMGRWVDKRTGVSVGGPNGEVEFTIIGLNISQSMLSLIGSLQPDPFNPLHKPLPATSPRKHKNTSSQTDFLRDQSPVDTVMENESDKEDMENQRARHRFESVERDTDTEDEVPAEDKDINDVFAELGRETDKMSREVAKEAKLESKRRKEERRLKKQQESGKKDKEKKKEKKKKKKGNEGT
ncbi:hypothetical protein FRC17_007620 [Serendipita sp. 399]|nr:hypothetical protein FRC17_007620 [Serendipita sp. 399]